MLISLSGAPVAKCSLERGSRRAEYFESGAAQDVSLLSASSASSLSSPRVRGDDDGTLHQNSVGAAGSPEKILRGVQRRRGASRSATGARKPIGDVRNSYSSSAVYSVASPGFVRVVPLEPELRQTGAIKHAGSRTARSSWRATTAASSDYDSGGVSRTQRLAGMPRLESRVVHESGATVRAARAPSRNNYTSIVRDRGGRSSSVTRQPNRGSPEFHMGRSGSGTNSKSRLQAHTGAIRTEGMAVFRPPAPQRRPLYLHHPSCQQVGDPAGSPVNGLPDLMWPSPLSGSPLLWLNARLDGAREGVIGYNSRTRDPPVLLVPSANGASLENLANSEGPHPGLRRPETTGAHRTGGYNDSGGDNDKDLRAIVLQSLADPRRFSSKPNNVNSRSNNGVGFSSGERPAGGRNPATTNRSPSQGTSAIAGRELLEPRKRDYRSPDRLADRSPDILADRSVEPLGADTDLDDSCHKWRRGNKLSRREKVKSTLPSKPLRSRQNCPPERLSDMREIHGSDEKQYVAAAEHDEQYNDSLDESVSAPEEAPDRRWHRSNLDPVVFRGGHDTVNKFRERPRGTKGVQPYESSHGRPETDREMVLLLLPGPRAQNVVQSYSQEGDLGVQNGSPRAVGAMGRVRHSGYVVPQADRVPREGSFEAAAASSRRSKFGGMPSNIPANAPANVPESLFGPNGSELGHASLGERRSAVSVDIADGDISPSGSQRERSTTTVIPAALEVTDLGETIIREFELQEKRHESVAMSHVVGGEGRNGSRLDDEDQIEGTAAKAQSVRRLAAAAPPPDVASLLVTEREALRRQRELLRVEQAQLQRERRQLSMDRQLLRHHHRQLQQLRRPNESHSWNHDAPGFFAADDLLLKQQQQSGLHPPSPRSPLVTAHYYSSGQSLSIAKSSPRPVYQNGLTQSTPPAGVLPGEKTEKVGVKAMWQQAAPEPLNLSPVMETLATTPNSNGDLLDDRTALRHPIDPVPDVGDPLKPTNAAAGVLLGQDRDSTPLLMADLDSSGHPADSNAPPGPDPGGYNNDCFATVASTPAIAPVNESPPSDPNLHGMTMQVPSNTNIVTEPNRVGIGLLSNRLNFPVDILQGLLGEALVSTTRNDRSSARRGGTNSKRTPRSFGTPEKSAAPVSKRHCKDNRRQQHHHSAKGAPKRNQGVTPILITYSQRPQRAGRSSKSSALRDSQRLIFPYYPKPDGAVCYRGYPIDGGKSMKSWKWKVQLVGKPLGPPTEPLPQFPQQERLLLRKGQYVPIEPLGLSMEDEVAYNSGVKYLEESIRRQQHRRERKASSARRRRTADLKGTNNGIASIVAAPAPKNRRRATSENSNSTSSSFQCDCRPISVSFFTSGYARNSAVEVPKPFLETIYNAVVNPGGPAGGSATKIP